MNAHDIRKLTSEQIKDELIAARRKTFELRAQAVTEKIANVSQFGTLRRTIARLLTEQGARVRAAAPAGGRKMIRGLSKEARRELLPKTVSASAFTKMNPNKSAKKPASAAAASSKPKTRRKAEVKS